MAVDMELEILLNQPREEICEIHNIPLESVEWNGVFDETYSTFYCEESKKESCLVCQNQNCTCDTEYQEVADRLINY